MLSHVRPNNDTAHPLCVNLREGDWMLDYVVKRLRHCQGTKPVSNILGVWMMGFEFYIRKLRPWILSPAASATNVVL